MINTSTIIYIIHTTTSMYVTASPQSPTNTNNTNINITINI